MGYILDSSNHFQRAYACGIPSGKAYCLEDSKDGTAFESNIAILNQVFSKGECESNSNKTRYTCSRTNEPIEDTRKDGYVSVHYKENCHIFDSRSNYEMYCY